ncbi:MAG: class I SAM-dependent methyltransferase [Chloroflexota bacterium]|nr:class I SAM-dependent methyltransferase [Chloroflexota bacterium]
MALAQFAREYRTVRRAEGWGSPDGAYYRALPFHDLTGRFPHIWRIRARSYQTFVTHVLEPLETRVSGRLRILDVGAGSSWLAYRLALRGHRVVAIDLLDDALDGLGARHHYEIEFAAVLAEYDRLPLACQQLDLVVFNASLHYSSDYAATLRETLRVLRQPGTLVILDSPTYVDPTSGARMVEERQKRFLATYGFASDALRSEHFLTPARLHMLASELGLEWRVHTPGLDWHSALDRAVGGLRAGREPARFPVIVGRSSP